VRTVNATGVGQQLRLGRCCVAELQQQRRRACEVIMVERELSRMGEGLGAC
jgi:hypothetical protein